MRPILQLSVLRRTIKQQINGLSSIIIMTTKTYAVGETEISQDLKPKRGRPINEGLAREVVRHAGHLFITHGYQGTTMESVAKRVGMSKLTLYKRFQTKDALFSATIAAKCDEFFPESLFLDIDGLPIEEALYRLGLSFLRLLMSHEAMAIENILRNEGDEHQQLRDLFYASGPMRMKTGMWAYFSGQKARGLLKFDDPVLTTNLFLALFKGSDIYMRCTMQISPEPTMAEIEAYCRQAVAFFIKACGT
jgi:TetR/AcrR family transcriptional regulator, mexJK operon transcriptional repressor